MNAHRSLVAFLLLGTLAATAEVRTWTARTGGHQTQAELVRVANGQVHLRKTDGSVVAVPLDQLRDEDRQYAEAQAAGPRPTPVEEPAGDDPPHGPAGAQSFPLTLRHLEPLRPATPVVPGAPGEPLYRIVTARFLHSPFGGEPDTNAEAFRRVIKAEPPYRDPQPFRAVLDLGTQHFGFALDSLQPAAGQNAAHDRLYLDLNGNGDLTDDQPIDAEKLDGDTGPARKFSYFPRISLAVDAGGSRVEYAFRLVASRNIVIGLPGVGVSLTPTVCREGTIVLAGRRRSVALVDFNCNGRFDDKLTISGGSPDGRVTPHGDLLILDPEHLGRASPADLQDPIAMKDHALLGRQVQLAGRYYDLAVTPAGDRLTLTPSAVPLGQVTRPCPGFSGVLYGASGVVKIPAGAAPVLVPEGRWQLLRYTIAHGATPAPAGRTTRKTPAVTPTTPPAPPRGTRLVAAGRNDSQAVEVRKDDTVKLPFGPPYRTVVRPSGRTAAGEAVLLLSLIGAGGEVCTDLQLDGRRPAPPQITIRDPDGRIVQEGPLRHGVSGMFGIYPWRVPAQPAKEYRVTVRMDAGPFAIDPSYESTIQTTALR